MDLIEINEQAISRHPWELARIQIVKFLINKIKKEKRVSTILDIGSGDLFVTDFLSKEFKNTSFYCLDIGYKEEDMKFYRVEYPTLNIYNDHSLLELELNKEQTVSLVLLLDVVEHVADDMRFLESIRNDPFITDDTIFLITVPAFQSLFSSHDVFLKHYRRYTNKTLLNLLDKVGMEPIGKGYFFSSLLIVRWFQFYFERWGLVKPSKGLSTWKGSPKLSDNLSSILYWEFRISFYISNLFGIKLPGLSNYLICKKQA